MENKDKKEFSRLLWIFANDAGVKISKEQLSIKFEVLKHFTIDQISKATTHLISYREKTWPAIPAISEFTKTIEDQTPQIELNMEAMLQCDIIMKYFNCYGRECDHKFKNTITNYLMTSRWSFKILGNMPDSELKWFRKNFVDAFQEIENNKIAFSDDASNTLPSFKAKRIE